MMKKNKMKLRFFLYLFCVLFFSCKSSTPGVSNSDITGGFVALIVIAVFFIGGLLWANLIDEPKKKEKGVQVKLWYKDSELRLINLVESKRTPKTKLEAFNSEINRRREYESNINFIELNHTQDNNFKYNFFRELGLDMMKTKSEWKLEEDLKKLLRKDEEKKYKLKKSKKLKESKEKEPEIYNADRSLNVTIRKLNKVTYKCKKCNSQEHRIWSLTNSFLELRCNVCKTKSNYNHDIGLLEELISKIALNEKRLDKEYENEFWSQNEVKLDFTGKTKASPQYYEYLIYPENEFDNSAPKKSRKISQKVKDEVWKRDEGKCIECGSKENLEFDHIIPFSKGGANTYRNIQLLCESCNRSKSNKIG